MILGSVGLLSIVVCVKRITVKTVYLLMNVQVVLKCYAESVGKLAMNVGMLPVRIVCVLVVAVIGHVAVVLG